MAEMIKFKAVKEEDFDFSKPANIKTLRANLGMSANTFGQLLGLDASKGNHGRTVRYWESGEVIPSGVAQNVMKYLSQGVNMDNEMFDKIIPKFILGSDDSNKDELVVHLHYPRYLAQISDSVHSSLYAKVSASEYLNLILTIDASEESKIKESLEKAADWVDKYTVKILDEDD